LACGAVSLACGAVSAGLRAVSAGRVRLVVRERRGSNRASAAEGERLATRYAAVARMRRVAPSVVWGVRLVARERGGSSGRRQTRELERIALPCELSGVDSGTLG
jgi:hypothetical protein